jgi:MFS family permease
MTLEHAPSHRRAFFASWVNTGAGAGIMLASLAFLAVSLMPQDQLLSWGWRLPFLASIIVAAAGLIIRTRLPESPAFEEEHATVGRPELPIKVVFRDNWRTVLKVMVFGLWTVVSSIVSAFSLSYATNSQFVPGSVMLAVNITTAALGIASQPLFGMLADRIGRKPVFITGNIVCAASIFAYFWSISQANIPLVFTTQIIVMVVGYGMVNPLGPAMVAEMFETRIRYSGAAISSQLGLVMTGFAPTIAAAIVRPGPDGWMPVAVFTASCCVISALVALLWVRETYKVATEDLGKKAMA